MYKWFRDCKTAEEGKALYHTLAKKYHADNNGDENILKEINVEFKTWWKEFKNIHQTTEGHTYTKENNENIEAFMDILSKLSRHQGLKVDLCGSWLWISGNTFPVRESLKAYGCQWSVSKKKWFWAADVKQKAGRGHYSEEQITRRHGRVEIKLDYNPVLGLE